MTAGAQYQQETLSWMGQKMGLVVEKYGSTIDEGFFALVPIEDMQKEKQQQTEANKKALQ